MAGRWGKIYRKIRNQYKSRIAPMNTGAILCIFIVYGTIEARVNLQMV